MPTIHFSQKTTGARERYSAGLTDIGPGRSKLCGSSSAEDLKVHTETEFSRRRH